MIKQNVALENMMTDTRDKIDQIPGTVEQVLVRHLDQYGRRLSILQQNILNASSRQVQTMQQVVRFLSTANEMCSP